MSTLRGGDPTYSAILTQLQRLGNLIACSTKSVLTTTEAAEYMGYEARTMRQLARDRAITHYRDRHGRIIRFRREELDAYMQYTRIDSREEIDDALAQRELENRRRGFKNSRL